MRLAIDLDGVCYEWSRTAMYMLRRYRGCSHLTTESTSWNYIQERVSKEDWRWLWSTGVKQGLFRYGHMVKDARWGLEGLSDYGHTLSIVSHRPAAAINDTLDWCAYHFEGIPLEGFHLLTQQEPKTEVPWDLLIDDKKENIDDALEANRMGMLFDREWNQGVEAPVRVFGWQGVVDSLCQGESWV